MLMKRWTGCLAVLAILVSPTVFAQVNAIPAAPHLLVKGHAEGHYVPDRFIVYVQVDVTDMVPDKARRRVEAHMRQIFAALEKNGAMRDRTRASSLQIKPNNDYRDGKQVFLGTEVSRGVEATFASLEQLRNFIAWLPANEEVQLSRTDVGRSDIGKIRLDLRNRAMANSRQAAERIAAAYGMRVKGIYSVSEVAPDFAYGIQAGSWDDVSAMPAAAAPPPPAVLSSVTVRANELRLDLRAGTIDLSQDIYAVYLTAPQAAQ
jgi:uncharacterized protein YggE